MSETAKNYGSIYDLPLQNASALAPEIEKRTVYGPEGGVWKDYVMRHFILPPHRGIPAHVHDWDHLATASSKSRKSPANARPTS